MGQPAACAQFGGEQLTSIVAMAHFDDVVSRPPRDASTMIRSLSVLRVAALALFVAACGAAPASTPGATAASPTATPAPASLAPTTAPATSGPTFDVGSLLGGTVTEPAGTTWTRIADPGAPFTYEVPSAWTTHAAYPWQDGGATLGTVLAAGPDLAKFSTDFTVPAVAIGLSGNPVGRTVRQVVEADASVGGACTAGTVQDASESGVKAAYQLWEGCGGGTGFLLVMAIAPAEATGLIAIILQGSAEADIGYLPHILGSIAAATVDATPGPGPSGVPPATGPTYTISMNLCQNQHGQGVAEGLIRNEDGLVHTYRIVVAFSDANDVFLNDTSWTTSDLPPAITARWQAMVPSGLPAVSVVCRITAVEVIR
jgi:hypothetical protein